jgi:hypothetical protein
VTVARVDGRRYDAYRTRHCLCYHGTCTSRKAGQSRIGIASIRFVFRVRRALAVRSRKRVLRF